MATINDQVDAFHAHLDVCRQCREHPFAICPNGYKLLVDAATTAPTFPGMQPPPEKRSDKDARP